MCGDMMGGLCIAICTNMHEAGRGHSMVGMLSATPLRLKGSTWLDPILSGKLILGPAASIDGMVDPTHLVCLLVLPCISAPLYIIQCLLGTLPSCGPIPQEGLLLELLEVF